MINGRQIAANVFRLPNMAQLVVTIGDVQTNVPPDYLFPTGEFDFNAPYDFSKLYGRWDVHEYEMPTGKWSLSGKWKIANAIWGKFND